MTLSEAKNWLKDAKNKRMRCDIENGWLVYESELGGWLKFYQAPTNEGYKPGVIFVEGSDGSFDGFKNPTLMKLYADAWGKCQKFDPYN